MTGRDGKKTPAEPTLSELALKLEPDLSQSETLGEADLTLLWSEVGSDFDHGIRRVADKLEVSEDCLLKLLADSAAVEAEARRTSGPKGSWRWIKAHWPEVTFAALAALAVLLILRAAGALAFVSPALAPRRPVVVRTVSQLPAYRVIRPEDVKQEEAEAVPEIGRASCRERV